METKKDEKEEGVVVMPTKAELQKLQIKEAVNTRLAGQLYSFNKVVENNPSPKWVKEHPSAKGVRYLPIRVIESLLRTIYGQYQVEWNGQPQILGNAVVCSVTLKVYHPISQTWLSYAGVGAVPVQLAGKTKYENGQKVTNPDGARHALDFERMISTALQKNIPAAKSLAINNAAKSLGNLFGAGLNTKDDLYVPSVTDPYDTQGPEALADLMKNS